MINFIKKPKYLTHCMQSIRIKKKKKKIEINTSRNISHGVWVTVVGEKLEI